MGKIKKAEREYVDNATFQEYTKQLKIKYNVDDYKWRELIFEMINIGEREELHLLHKTFTGQKFLEKMGKVKGTLENPFFGQFHQSRMDRPKVFKNYNKTLRKFIKEVIAPHIGGLPVIYQAKPTLRIMMPSPLAVGRPHQDSEYYHPKQEINFWFPVCDFVKNENTLYSESEPGKGDFEPFNLLYGEVNRFYGNQCHHYTVPNTTEYTRVSLDIRVVPGTLFDVDYINSLSRFKIGGYYHVLNVDFQESENENENENVFDDVVDNWGVFGNEDEEEF